MNLRQRPQGNTAYGGTTTAVDPELFKIASTLQMSDELREDAAFVIGAIECETILSILVNEDETIVAALLARQAPSRARVHSMRVRLADSVGCS